MSASTLHLICLAIIIYSIVIYQLCLYLNVLSLDKQLLLSPQLPLSRTPKPRSRVPPWPYVRASTTTMPPYTNKVQELNNIQHLCDIPTELGPISVNMSDTSLKEVENKYPQVERGGRYSPPNCTARHKVAIIVPYRDRTKNLATFLNHMHPFLMKQKLEYGIFLVEQTGTHEFNRGKLLNVGFVETPHWPCYIFHDIDLLPLDERNIYSCPDPRHPRMLDAIAGLEEDAVRLARRGNYGGVSALTEEQFNKVNGYSNEYWGLGGEENDLYFRLYHSGYITTAYNLSIARYATLQHKEKSQSPRRYRHTLQTMNPSKQDGLSTLHYSAVTTRHPLYTLIQVNIDRTYHEIQELLEEEDKMQKAIEKF